MARRGWTILDQTIGHRDSNTYNGLSRLFEQLVSITASLRVAVGTPRSADYTLWKMFRLQQSTDDVRRSITTPVLADGCTLVEEIGACSWILAKLGLEWEVLYHTGESA